MLYWSAVQGGREGGHALATLPERGKARRDLDEALTSCPGAYSYGPLTPSMPSDSCGHCLWRCLGRCLGRLPSWLACAQRHDVVDGQGREAPSNVCTVLVAVRLCDMTDRLPIFCKRPAPDCNGTLCPVAAVCQCYTTVHESARLPQPLVEGWLGWRCGLVCRWTPRVLLADTLSSALVCCGAALTLTMLPVRPRTVSSQCWLARRPTNP